MKEQKSFKKNLKVIFGTITLLLVLSQALSMVEIVRLSSSAGQVAGNIISQLVILVINMTAVWAGYSILSKKLLAPLIEMDGAATELAAGNLNIDINHESSDEVGYLADSFRSLIEGENTIINDMTHIIRQFNEGNFDQRTSCEEAYKGSYAVILKELRALAISFSTTMAGIDEAAEQVSMGSDDLSGCSQDLARGAADQAAVVEQLLASVINITERLSENTQATNQACDNVKVINEQAEVSSHKMDELMGAMGSIRSASSEIEDNSAAAQQNSATSQELAAQAALLKGMVQQFKLRQA